ncbi:PREDICTED: uncharacterized protein LOC104750010 [Camelina sativa]|uniref:Uncharacterized protein LOC104750010 n=1 Tax=Camelina sativa TaxID=90675 RepID=A0ABM1R2L2_CAMSA|nr:PREDICTED: uncharacterized protein LOC104750010 [Camelina sativa]
MVLEPIGDHQIDEQKFRFRNYENSASIVDTNADLFDVIGLLRLIVGDNIHSPSTLETSQQVLGDNGHNTPKIARSSSAVTKLETVTIQEILQFLQNENPQLLLGTILDIQPQYGWYYISCSKCNNKLEKADTSLYCNYCKESNNIGVIRYRFEIRVSDKNKDVATFVVLDSEATKIAGRRAADVLNEEMEASSTTSYTEINLQTPECLKHIVGNTCKFQIKLSEYNFKTSRQTVSISRILETITDHPAESEEGSSTKSLPETQSTTTTCKSREKSHVNDSTDKNRSTLEKCPRLDNK